MGQIEITNLNDIVDTLKLQFYPNSNITLEEIEKFNSLIDGFVELKQDAMTIKNADNQKRFIKTQFAKTGFNVMAVSQGSFNVLLQNGDITISLLRISRVHSNPVVKVEFRAEFLLRHGYKNAINSVKNIINEMFENYLIKVSEIHLAKDVQGYEFSMFDFHRIKTLSKTKTVFHNDISSEYYFGNRFTGFAIGRGDEMLRIYNKTVEIAKKKEKAFIEVLAWSQNPDFDKTRNVWRIEFQLRRERLKHLLGSNGLLDSLDNVIYSIHSLWKYCVSRFQHKEMTNQQLIEQVQQFKYKKDGSVEILSPETLRKRFQRAELSQIWLCMQTFEGREAPTLQKIKDIKKPEVEYVKNGIKTIISTLIKLKRGDFNIDDLSSIVLEADEESKQKHGLSMVDKARMNALDYISKAQVFYENNGIVEDGFYQYKKDFVSNLSDTFALIANEPSSLYTFQEFQKRIFNV